MLRRALVVLIAVSLLLTLSVMSEEAIAQGRLEKKPEVPQEKMTTYTDEKNGFSISYPEGWEIGTPEYAILLVMDKKGTELVISRDEVDPGTFVQDYTSMIGDWLEENMDDYQELVLEKAAVAGTGAMMRIYTYSYTDEEGKSYTIKAMEAYVLKDNFGFSIVCDTYEDLYEEKEPLFEGVIESFKFTTPAVVSEGLLRKPPTIGAKFDLEVHSDSQNGFSISYPKGWDTPPPEKDAVFFANDGKDLFLTILKHPLQPNITLESYAQGAGDWLKQKQNYQELSTSPITLSGGEKGLTRVYTYDFVDQDGNKFPIKVTEVYVVKNTQGFTIVWDVSASVYEEKEPLFEGVIESFKFTTPAVVSEGLRKKPPTIGAKFELEVHSDPQSGFSISYPKGWDTSPPEENIVFSADDGSVTYFLVLREALQANVALDQYVEGTGNWLRNKHKNYQELSMDPITLSSGEKGFIRSYTYDFVGQDGKEYPTKTLEVYAVKGNYGFSVVCETSASLYAEEEPLFKEIINSFKLTGEAVTVPTEPVQPPGGFTTYNNPQGYFSANIPSGWQKAEETEDEVYFIDKSTLSEIYISYDVLPAGGVTQYLNEGISEIQSMQMPGFQIITQPQNYPQGAQGAIAVVQTQGLPAAPEIKKNYYILGYALPKGNAVIALVISTPVDNYEKIRTTIDQVINSLK